MAAVLLAVFVLVPAVGDAGQDVARARAGDLSGIHIDNLGQVNANYYRGAAPDDQEVANLAAFGIRTVIDLRKDVDSEERVLVERAGMKYVHIPMTTHTPPLRAVIEQFLGIVDAPENQPVYVHCARGRHRTGIMTAIYRMTREGWSAYRAFKEMKAYRFGADFLHPEFKEFVLRYRPDPSIAPSTGATAGATR